MSEGKTWTRTLPGLGLCAALAVLAMLTAESAWVKETLHFSALLVVILFGIVVASVVRLPKEWTEGVKVAQKPVLRWAVAGLGLQLSLPALAKTLGPSALAVVVFCTFGTVLAGFAIFRLFGLGDKLRALLSVGTAVCGASAIVAADTVVQSEGKDSAISLGVVTLWGTVGIFAYPLIGQAFHLTPFAYALWSGVSLHETAQVAAAASGFHVPVGLSATESGDLMKVLMAQATAAKLARILLLGPIVYFLGAWMKRRGEESGKATLAVVPWFLIGFVVLAGVRTVADQNHVDKSIFDSAKLVVTFLMATGMAGVGLQTGIRDLKEAGWKPVLGGLCLWTAMAVVSLLLALAVPAP